MNCFQYGISSVNQRVSERRVDGISGVGLALKVLINTIAQTEKWLPSFQCDKFVLEAVTIQDLERVSIGHDGVGPGAGWFLDRLEVQEVAAGNANNNNNADNVYVFPCGQWLDSHNGNFSTEAELRNTCEFILVQLHIKLQH